MRGRGRGRGETWEDGVNSFGLGVGRQERKVRGHREVLGGGVQSGEQSGCQLKEGESSERGRVSTHSPSVPLPWSQSWRESCSTPDNNNS